MSPPNLACQRETDAPKGDLLACEHAPRPIHHPETGQDSRLGGGR